MTDAGPDHATPPELRGLPRTSYARSHAPLEETVPCPYPPYPTEDAAFDVLEASPAMRAVEREPTATTTGIHVGVYRCDRCAQYHIGRFVVFAESPA